MFWLELRTFLHLHQYSEIINLTRYERVACKMSTARIKRKERSINLTNFYKLQRVEGHVSESTSCVNHNFWAVF